MPQLAKRPRRKVTMRVALTRRRMPKSRLLQPSHGNSGKILKIRARRSATCIRSRSSWAPIPRARDRKLALVGKLEPLAARDRLHEAQHLGRGAGEGREDLAQARGTLRQQAVAGRLEAHAEFGVGERAFEGLAIGGEDRR